MHTEATTERISRVISALLDAFTPYPDYFVGHLNPKSTFTDTGVLLSHLTTLERAPRLPTDLYVLIAMAKIAIRTEDPSRFDKFFVEYHRVQGQI